MDCLIKYIGIWTILYGNMLFKYFSTQNIIFMIHSLVLMRFKSPIVNGCRVIFALTFKRPFEKSIIRIGCNFESIKIGNGVFHQNPSSLFEKFEFVSGLGI